MNITDWPNPDSWIDIFAYFLVAVFMLLIAVIPTWMTIRSSRGIKDIKGQVVNGHKSPLRDDLDAAIKAIAQLGKELSNFRNSITRDVEAIRHQIADEEDRRRSHVSELRSDHERLWQSLHDRMDEKDK